jgi:hypothetical protein
MFNPLTIWKGNNKINQQQGLKNRVLKNREAILDVMAENIKGARQCEALLGAKCIGAMCEHFQEYKNINEETGKEFVYHRCVYNQMAELQIEIIQNIRETNKLLKELLIKGEIK